MKNSKRKFSWADFKKNRNYKTYSGRAKTTLDEEVRCNCTMLVAFDEEFDKRVNDIYNGFREAYLAGKNSGFSPESWEKDAHALQSMIEMILNDEADDLSSRQKTEFLVQFDQLARKTILDLTTFSLFHSNLFKIKELVEMIPQEYLTSAENAYNYSAIYYDLDEDQKSAIYNIAKKAKFNFVRLSDMQELANDAFELAQYQEIRNPIVTMHNSMAELRKNYNEYDKNWNGLISRMLYVDDKSGVDYITHCLNVSKSNIEMIQHLIDFEVEIPEIKILEKKYTPEPLFRY